MYLTTPNYCGTIGLDRAYRWARGKTFDEGGQPICQLTMIPRARAAGLRVIETDTTGRYLSFPGRPPIELPRLERPHALMRRFGLHSLVVVEKSMLD